MPLPWRELRFDFVVIKCTGECVRLPPGEKADAKLVVGQLSTWQLHNPSPADRRQCLIGTADRRSGLPAEAVLDYGRQDVVSTERALTLAVRMYHDYIDQGGDDSILDEDMYEDFPWQRFFIGREFGKDLRSRDIRMVRLRKRPLDSYPSIYVECEDDSPGQGRHVVFMYGKCKLD